MTSEEYKEQLSEALGKLAGVHAVGDSWITFDGSIPAGGVPFTGQLVTRAMYADLWAWVQTNKTVVTDAAWQTTANAQNGMNAAYSSGDGSTTFRLPCAVGGYLQAGDTSTAGQYVKEGLPGINASYINNGLGDQAGYTGAFYSNETRSRSYAAHNATTVNIPLLSFSASRCSSVYRDDCQHVTPETFKVMVGVYAFGVAGPVGESTEAGLVAEMNRKADIDASNFSAAGKNVLAGMGMPSGRYVNLSTPANNSEYTAPENGWFYCQALPSSSASHVGMFNYRIGNFGVRSQSTLVNTAHAIILPVRKGDTAKIFLSNVTIEICRFIYAEGATG